MTNEQREAINNIKVFIRSIRSDLVEESEDNQELSNDLDTVLSLIKEKQREIQRRDKIINEMIEEYEYNDGINVKKFCDEEIRKDKCIKNCTICMQKYFADLVEKE